jgi:hypothetical protein
MPNEWCKWSKEGNLVFLFVFVTLSICQTNGVIFEERGVSVFVYFRNSWCQTNGASVGNSVN